MIAAEAGRQFADTNLLVYAHDLDAGPKAARAQELLASLWGSGAGCLSLQVLQEFYVTVTRRLRRALTHETAVELVEDFSRWTLHSPGREDLLVAIQISHRHRLSLWDALIVRSASRLGCKVLWTEDLKDGEIYEGVRARNPFR
jgi:predicted nucleic acid-binding protein